MFKEILTFGDDEIGKSKFYSHESPIFLKVVDIGKALVCNKISSGERNYKYFIGYLYNDHEVKPLHIMLPKTSTLCKNLQTNWMDFLIENDGLLKNIILIKLKWLGLSKKIPSVILF